MAKLAADPRNRKWLAIGDPMQGPLEGETGRGVMEQIDLNP